MTDPDPIILVPPAELQEAREHHFKGMALAHSMAYSEPGEPPASEPPESLEGVIERQAKSIRMALWCLSQGWPGRARKALEEANI